MLVLISNNTVDQSRQELSDKVNHRFKVHHEGLPFNVLVSTIKSDFPNMKKSDYLAHSKTPVNERLRVAEELAHIIRGQAYHDKTFAAIEQLADYILAEDHAKGLQISRKPNTIELNEFPPLGEGAREYLERQYIGVPITIGEKRKVKRCEICESEFIDKTKNGFAKVCGDSCREEKERRRQKKLYNGKVHNIDEARYKRDWQRQQYGYPFYSPKELFEIEIHGEVVVNNDSFNRGKLAKKAYVTIDGEKSPHDYGGRKAPKFKSLSDIEGDKDYEKLSHRYDPRGNDRRQLNWKNLRTAYDRNCGEVITYHITELDRSKDFSESRNISFRVVEKCI